MTDRMQEKTVSATDANGMDELTLLKRRADTLGMKYHPNIGLDKLKEKMAELTAEEIPTEVQTPLGPKGLVGVDNETKAQREARMRRNANRLVRVIVTCRNPNKSEWPGEIFTVSNSVVGSIKKYVPFDNTEGWHVPQIIVNMMRERKCQVFYTTKDNRGNKIRKGRQINEFAIEVLDPLTETQLKELGQRQLMASGSAEQIA